MIRELNIGRETQGRDGAQKQLLLDYCYKAEGERGVIIQQLRPVLETHCHKVSTALIAMYDALGTIVDMVRDAGAGEILYPIVDDLDSVDRYSRNHHHE